MFTAARLIAALCLAVFGYLGSEYVKTLMPQSTTFGIFTYVNTVLGFLCGWIIVGPRAGRGTAAAVSHGITGAVALILWALLGQAANEMVRLALRHRYHSLLEALAAVFEIAVEFGAVLLDPGFFLLMAVGAVVTGLLSETAARHWR